MNNDYVLLNDDKVILKVKKCKSCNKYMFRSRYFYNSRMNKICDNCYKVMLYYEL